MSRRGEQARGVVLYTEIKKFQQMPIWIIHKSLDHQCVIKPKLRPRCATSNLSTWYHRGYEPERPPLGPMVALLELLKTRPKKLPLRPELLLRRLLDSDRCELLGDGGPRPCSP